MAKRIILLSGPVGAGKSTLASALSARYALLHLKTQDLVCALKKGVERERGALQRAGEALDRERGGAWVRDALLRTLQVHPEDATVVVDAVRTKAQVDGIRSAYGSRVVHVHLTAPTETLARRHAARKGPMRDLPYAAVIANRTEARVSALAKIADIVIDTGRSTMEDVVVRGASRLGMYGRGPAPLVDVLVGGQWGSEGKGNIAAYLAPEYDVLVRVGGPNAGHKVYEEPKPATFYHLPSGTKRAPGAKIVLGAGSVLRPDKLLEEINEWELGPERLLIDPQAMIIESADVRFEERLKKSIGSTGQGVGYATARKILRNGVKPRVRLAAAVPELRPFLRDTLEVLDDAFCAGQRVFLEGTQGTGLSLHHGDYPWVTSRDTTVSGCLADAGIAPSRVRRIIMVCRTYPIRVESPADGSSGPMGRDIDWATVAERSGIAVEELREAEKTTTTKRKRRVAEFNWALLRTAASLNGPTDIALSFADHHDIRNRKARRFEQLRPETIQFIEEVERITSAPVSLIATRFAFRNVIDRRVW